MINKKCLDRIGKNRQAVKLESMFGVRCQETVDGQPQVDL
jgi:hypothetical protein